MALPVLPTQGDLIAGKYRVDRVLGVGGMGIVYAAVHLKLRHRVAIKMVLPAVLAEQELVARFEREARAAASLESPHVAKVLDVDTSEAGLPYMVVEFLEGHDLGQELNVRGRLPITEAVDRLIEACAAVAEAHAAGIVHRDLKPSNLFLAKKTGATTLKLLDFGISKVASDQDATRTSSMQSLGTPQYMSPEQARRGGDVDLRSDLWSLGVILFEVLTGVAPFVGPPSAIISALAADPVPSPRALRPEIPEALESVIMRALEKDPARRFDDARELARALAPFASQGAFEREVFPSMRTIAAKNASTLPPPGEVAAADDASETPRPRLPTLASWTGRVSTSTPVRAARWPWGVAVAVVVSGAVAWTVIAARSGGEAAPPRASAGAPASVAMSSAVSVAPATGLATIAPAAAESAAALASASPPAVASAAPRKRVAAPPSANAGSTTSAPPSASAATPAAKTTSKNPLTL